MHEEFHNLYFVLIKHYVVGYISVCTVLLVLLIKCRMRWEGHKSFVGNHERKRPLKRAGCRWKVIKVYVRYTLWGCGVGSSYLDRI